MFGKPAGTGGNTRRHTRLHFLAGLVVGAARQHVGLARSRTILHDHHGRKTVDQPVPLLAQIQHIPVRGLYLFRRILFEETRAQLRRLGRSAPGGRHLHEAAYRLRHSQHRHLFRAQRAAIHAHLGHLAAEAVFRSQTAADPQRLFRVERLVHVVQIGFGPQRPAIQVKAHSAGQPRAIIGEAHVRPTVQRHGLFTLHAHSVVQPALHQARAQMSVLEYEAEAFSLGFIVRAADDRTGADGRIDPCREGERIVESEVADVAHIHIALAIELANRAHRTGAVLRCPLSRRPSA